MYNQVESLDTFLDGALTEKFNRAFAQCLINICDPNTTAKKPREVNIKIKIEPDEERVNATITAEVTSKLCGSRGIQKMVTLEEGDDGIVTAYEALKGAAPGQLDFGGRFAPDMKVLKFDNQGGTVKDGNE